MVVQHLWEEAEVVVESWWGSLRTRASTSLFTSDVLMLFCAHFPPLGNSMIMADVQTWQQNWNCFAEEEV